MIRRDRTYDSSYIKRGLYRVSYGRVLSYRLTRIIHLVTTGEYPIFNT